MKNLIDDKTLSTFCINQANLLDEYATYLFFLWYKSRSEYFGPVGLDDGFDWADIKNGYKKRLDRVFKDLSDEILSDFVNGGGKPYFPDDPEKDHAVGFFLTSEHRDEFDLKDKNYFKFLAYDMKALSILFGNYQIFAKTIRSEWDGDFFIALNELKDDVVRESHELIGYWIAKGSQIKAIKPGAEAKRRRKQERVAKIKSEIEKKFKIEKKKIQIPRDQFYAIVQNIMGYKFPVVDYKTVISYKKELARLISEEKGEEIQITLKKD